MQTTRSLLEKFRIKKGFNLISLPTITLVEEEADRFIDYVVDQSVMKQYARIERMNKPQKNIRALGFGQGRFLFPAGAFDETKYKRQWINNKIQLVTKKARGAIVVFDDDIEDLSGITTEAQYMDQLMRIVGKKISMELEEAGWISDTHSLNAATWGADDIRSLWNGWRYRLTHSDVGQEYHNAAAIDSSRSTGGAKILNAAEGGSSGDDFSHAGKIAEQGASAPYNWEIKYQKMLRAMPPKYKMANGLAEMRFLNSDLVTQDFIAYLYSRIGGGGGSISDQAITGDAPLRFGKVGIADVPLMPTNLGDPEVADGVVGAGAYTDSLLIPRGNFIIGIQRDIKIESQRIPADEATYVFYSLRMDFAVENVDAAVLCSGLTTGS